MEWYLAKIIFRIVCSDGNHAPQFDEQLRLIAAANHREALHKATSLGECAQHRFPNERQQWVHWQFINVAELARLGKLEDGTELHYRIAEPDNADRYIALIHEKAARISGDPCATGC